MSDKRTITLMTYPSGKRSVFRMEITDWISAFSAFCSAGAAVFAWKTSNSALTLSRESNELAKEDRRLAALERFHLVVTRSKMQCAILHSSANDAQQMISSLAMKSDSYGSSRVKAAIEEAEIYTEYAERKSELLTEINGRHSDENDLPSIAALTRDAQVIQEFLDASILLCAELKNKWRS